MNTLVDLQERAGGDTARLGERAASIALLDRVVLLAPLLDRSRRDVLGRVDRLSGLGLGLRLPSASASLLDESLGGRLTLVVAVGELRDLDGLRELCTFMSSSPSSKKQMRTWPAVKPGFALSWGMAGTSRQLVLRGGQVRGGAHTDVEELVGCVLDVPDLLHCAPPLRGTLVEDADGVLVTAAAQNDQHPIAEDAVAALSHFKLLKLDSWRPVSNVASKLRERISLRLAIAEG